MTRSLTAKAGDRFRFTAMAKYTGVIVTEPVPQFYGQVSPEQAVEALVLALTCGGSIAGNAFEASLAAYYKDLAYALATARSALAYTAEIEFYTDETDQLASRLVEEK